MNKIESLEDLVAWQKARALAHLVADESRNGTWGKAERLAGQIVDTGTAIMSRVAEGFERRERIEFAHCLGNAKGTCGELRSLLYLASDRGCLNSTQLETLLRQVEEVSRIVGGLRAALGRQQPTAPRPTAESQAYATDPSDTRSSPPRSIALSRPPAPPAATGRRSYPSSTPPE
jgi:four helix bundle protein